MCLPSNAYVNITKIRDRQFRFNCYNEKEYKKYLKENPDMCEVIGEYRQFIKPVFDVDAYENDIDVNEVKNDINKLFSGKPINYAKREPRQTKKGVKFSYRFYVDKVKIYSALLKQLMIDNQLDKNPIYDLSIYDKNKVLFLPLTTQKTDGDTPELTPIDCDIFECCASYVEDSFEDWTVKCNIKKDVVNTDNNSLKYENTHDNEEEVEEVVETTKGEENLTKYLNELNKNRFDNFYNWINIMFAIIHIGKKQDISKIKTRKLIHHYSSLSENYEEDSVEKWFNNNYEKQKDKTGYGYPYIFDCIKQDNPDYYDKNIKRTYFNIKRDFDKKIFKCNDPIGFIEINLEQDELNQKPYYILTRQQIIEKYEEIMYWEIDDNEKWKQKSFTSKWLKDPSKKIYNSVVFKPMKLSRELNNKHFNLFKGFRVQKLKECRDYESIQPILEHIRIVLCKNRPDVYEWLIQYFAQVLKNPQKKTDVVLFFKSKAGAGKNTIIDMIANGIIGNEYAVSTNNPERVFFGNFNSLLANKVFAVCNEAGNGMRECIDRIKDVATAPTVNVEKKGKDPIVFDNYINIIGTTNNEYPIQISTDDRRICWIECSNEKVGDEEYFNKLCSLCENEEVVSSFYHYLCEEVEITVTNFQKTRPITDEYKRIQKLNVSNPIRFMMSIKDDFVWKSYKGRVLSIKKTKDLYSLYKNFCETTNVKAFNKEAFFYKIINEDSKIQKCVSHGYECVRIMKDEYINWFNTFEYLDKNEEIERIDDFIEDE